MYLFKFILLVALFHLSLAIKGQQLQQQCECAGEASPVIGTGVPVYNPYDDNCNLDTSKIPPYAAYLQKAGMNSATICTSRAGGALLTVAQQKLVTKAWCDVKKNTGFPYTLICQVVESNNYNDTIEIARYFKKSCCDVIAVGPPEDYPLAEIDDLVTYFSAIAKTCYPKPLLYITPLYTDCQFNYNPVKLFSSLCKACENFGGIQTNFLDCLLVQAGNDYYPNKMIVSDSSVDVVGAYSFCMNGSSALIANLMPKTVVQIQQLTFSGDVDQADTLQKEVNAFYVKALDYVSGSDRVDRSDLSTIIQMERILIKIIHGVDLGVIPTPPLKKITRDQVLRLYKVCEEAGVATTYPYDVDSYSDNDKNQYNKGKKNKGKYGSQWNDNNDDSD